MMPLAALHSNAPTFITSSNYKFGEIQASSDYTWGSPRGDSHINHIKNTFLGASLVAQWLRICLPMQGTRVQALVQEHPTEQLSPCATTTELVL